MIHPAVLPVLTAVVAAFCAPLAAVPLSQAIEGAVNGVVNLQAGEVYTGSANVASSLTINGNGATWDQASNGGSAGVLRLQGPGALTINNLNIEMEGTGIYVGSEAANATITLANVDLEGLPGGLGGSGITVDADNVTLDLTDCRFTNITDFGVTIRRPGATITALRTIFADMEVGIRTSSAILTATGCSFSGNFQALDGLLSATISDCAFTRDPSAQDTWAIKMTSPHANQELVNLDVRNSTFSGHGFGIAFTGNQLTVQESSFADHRIAIDAFHDLDIRDTSLTRSTLEDNTWGIKMNAVGGDPERIHVTADNVSVTNYEWGIDTPSRSLEVVNSSFTNGSKALIMTGNPGTAQEPVLVTNNVFRGQDSGAVDFASGGNVVLRENQWYNVMSAVYPGANSTIIFQDNVVDDEGRRPIQNALFGTGNITLEATGNTFRGFQNSIVLVTDCTLVADNNLFYAPGFSGVIIGDNSSATIRNNEFIDNGQDAIFSATEIPSLPGARPNSSIIENNFIINAGIGLPDPALERNEQAGTGIALQGNHTVRNNIVIASHDQGLTATGSPTNVIAENNVFLGGRLVAMYTALGANLTARNNIMLNCPTDGISGMGIRDTNGVGTLLAEGNAMVNNYFGFAQGGVSESTILRRNLIVGNRSQGISMTAGEIEANQLGLVGNGDWQALFTPNTGGGTISNSTFFADNQLGLLVQLPVTPTPVPRGAKQAAPVVTAEDGWWGPGGPLNSRLFSLGPGQMAYQEADVEPHAPVPPIEVFATLNSVPTVSATQRPWMEVQAPAPAVPANAVLAAMRFAPESGDFPELHRNLLADGRLIHLWVTPDWQNRPQPTEATLTIALHSSENVAALAQFHHTSGAFLRSIPVRTTGTPGVVQVVLPTSEVEMGVYGFTTNTIGDGEVQRLLGEGNEGQDANTDGVLDAADLVARDQEE